jgi:hypothetical protein
MGARPKQSSFQGVVFSFLVAVMFGELETKKKVYGNGEIISVFPTFVCLSLVRHDGLMDTDRFQQ